MTGSCGLETKVSGLDRTRVQFLKVLLLVLSLCRSLLLQERGVGLLNAKF